MTTSQSFGALDFPVPVVGPDHATGDPGLEVILSFLESVLNAYMQAAWARLGRAPGEKPVKTVFAHDVEESTLNNTYLPALYGWREEGESEQIAADYELDRSTLLIHWVFPAAIQPADKARRSIVNAVVKIVIQTLRRGCDPAWQAPGDTDPKSPDRGSLVWEWAGLWHCGAPRWRVQPVTIQGENGKEAWKALRLEIPITELLVDSPDDECAGIEADLAVPDPDDPDDPFVTNQIQLDPP